MTTRRLVYLGGAIAALFVVAWVVASRRERSSGDVDFASMSVPELSAEEQGGQVLFDANCDACHGANAAGSDHGPPLVHRIYEPSHHGDMAFMLAARQGVRAHHWQFGNMPTVEGVCDEEVLQIIAYVSALQRANGIN